MRNIELSDVISHMESTTEESWNLDTVRSKDGEKNCFFGHLFDMGADDTEGSDIWNWFENRWSSTYVIYPINDGTNARYQQGTPKQRVIAYLRNLENGSELDTMQAMEEDYQASLAAR